MWNKRVPVGFGLAFAAFLAGALPLGCSSADQLPEEPVESQSAAVGLNASKDGSFHRSGPYTGYNNGKSPQFCVGYVDDGPTANHDGHEIRAAIYFDVSGIPSTAQIDTATLELYQLNSPKTSISVSAANKTWDEGAGEVKCNGEDVDGLDNDLNVGEASWATAASKTTDAGWVSWTVTSIVQPWVSGSRTNHGFLLYANVDSAHNAVKFASRNYTTDTAHRPKLQITLKDGSTCSASNQCANGVCSSQDSRCCASHCTTPCYDCNGSGSCVKVAQGSTDNGCSGTMRCNDNGQCKKANGQSCSVDSDCAYGHCAPEGVCCDAACDGQCEACTNSRTGQANGECHNVSNLSDPDTECQPPGSFTCYNGSCSDRCNSNSDCTQGGNSNYFCDTDNRCKPKAGAGGACTDDDGCSAGTVCSADNTCCDSRCDGTCETCEGTAGTCTPYTLHTDPENECAPGSCSGNLDSCTTACSQDTHCDASAWCDGSNCITKYPNGTACSETRQCQSGRCVDGVCCNAACGGQCEACDNPGNVGSCTPTSGAPHGARPACAGDGTACNGLCDGSNRTQCALPGGGVECRAASCSAGQASLQTFCVGNGSCPAETLQPCAPFQCAGTGCLTTCTIDTQCQLGYRCDAGSCVPAKTNGESCTANPECASGYCVDGFCCNTACNGQCEACSVSGSEGACSAVTGAPVGARPSCADDGSACGGSCNGVARTACAYPGSSTECRASSCDTGSGVATLGAGCNGAGACPPLQTLSCPSGSCTGDGCGNDCTADADCGVDEYCVAGVCQTTQNLGSPCSRNAECGSGRCVDGYCCNSACSGQCEACDLGGNEGVCSAVTGAPHGARTACANDGSGCGGTCDGTSQTSCTYPGNSVVCRAAACSTGIATVEARCTGTGSCPSLQQQTCSPYTCHPSLPLCDGGCTVDGDCLAPQYCLAGICANPQGNGASCSTAGQCASGNCVDGVCCDDACGGQCQSCSEPGSIGTCTLVSGAPRGGRAACTGTGVCAGACDGSNPGCAFPGGETVCGLGSCSDDVSVPDASCNGAGECSAQTPQSCAPYHCGTGSACSSTCATADDCQMGYECNNGACEATISAGGAGGTGGAAGAAGTAGAGGASAGAGGVATGGLGGVGGGSAGGSPDAGVNTPDASDGLIPATDSGSTCSLAQGAQGTNPWGIYGVSLLGLLWLRRRRLPRRAVGR
ncbi:MAG: DNRLRE domain-containing protein [Polyangiaceae bacterium]